MPNIYSRELDHINQNFDGNDIIASKFLHELTNLLVGRVQGMKYCYNCTTCITMVTTIYIPAELCGTLSKVHSVHSRVATSRGNKQSCGNLMERERGKKGKK